MPRTAVTTSSLSNNFFFCIFLLIAGLRARNLCFGGVMLKRFLCSGGVGVCVALLLLSGGAQAADVKLGVMNVQRVLVECVAGKAAKARFDEKMQELQASAQERRGCTAGDAE